MDKHSLNEYAIGAYVIQSVATSARNERCDRCECNLDNVDNLSKSAACIRVFPWAEDTSLRCFSCALDCNVFELQHALRSDAVKFANRNEVEQALAERLRAMKARARGESVECVPARDAQGRPRVKALIHGLVINRISKTGKAFWSELRGRCAFASARREYAFGIPEGDDSLRSSDPAQPLIAYVYGLNARPADGITQANDDRTLRECFARGFPAPLLWLQGVSEKAARDKHIPRAREIVERAGFNADTCPTLCTKSMNREAIQALVQALDEHFSGAEIAPIAANKSLR